MFLKIHKSYRQVVGICDSKLIGQKFEEEVFQLDIKENFFKGEEINDEKAIEMMKDLAKEDATFYIVGEKSVAAALKAGIIDENGVGKIQEIPFALVLL